MSPAGRPVRDDEPRGGLMLRVMIAFLSLVWPAAGALPASAADLPLIGFIYPASPVHTTDLAARELARTALTRDGSARTILAIADGPDHTAEMARQLTTLGARAIVLGRRRAALDVVLRPGAATTLAWEGEKTDASATRLSARLETTVRLAGALAALASRSGRLAMVATPEDDDWADPFGAGIHLVNPDAELEVETPDDVPDVTAGRLAERGIDVVLTADTRLEMVQALARRGLHVIVLGGAPMVEPPGGVIASVVVDWLAFYRPVALALAADQPLPATRSLGPRDGAVSLDGPYLSLPPAAAEQFARYRREMMAKSRSDEIAPSRPSIAR